MNVAFSLPAILCIDAAVALVTAHGTAHEADGRISRDCIAALAYQSLGVARENAVEDERHAC